jgi:UPF0042 nucleotide-binding protein
MPSVVLVTGLSGSGKTTALRALEDTGWFCMDNVPVVLLPKVVELAGNATPRIAVVVDVRDRQFIRDAGAVLDELNRQGVATTVVFLDSDTDALVRRFRETRRRHPLSTESNDLIEAIAEERTTLDDLARRSALTINTSHCNVHELKAIIQQHFAAEGDRSMTVRVVSFGFKHGPLTDADLLFDVRFLPNPHFDPELRPRTGLQPEVSDFVLQLPSFLEFDALLQPLLAWLLPRYAAEGKVYLTIGVGCTGGKHRSVAIAEHLARTLSVHSRGIVVSHRDRAHWTTANA